MTASRKRSHVLFEWAVAQPANWYLIPRGRPAATSLPELRIVPSTPLDPLTLLRAAASPQRATGLRPSAAVLFPSSRSFLSYLLKLLVTAVVSTCRRLDLRAGAGEGTASWR
jgi:hypothetical protein